MSTTTDPPTDTRSTDRYLVVSGDSHAGPSLEHQLRPYCPVSELDAFDQFVHTFRARSDPELQRLASQPRTALGDAALARTAACPGLQDPHARIADMDADGVAAEVIFAGGQNDEVLPWGGERPFNAGPMGQDPERRALGAQIWNRWLADFVAPAPDRLIGVMQIPIWDLDASIREVEWGRAHGLHAVNLHAPRGDYPPYNEDAYDRFWSVCADLGVTLVTHGGGGERPLGGTGRAWYMTFLAEVYWLSRRGLWQMIFGGAFERHPQLQLVFAELGVSWVPDTLRELDAIWLSPNRLPVDAPPRRPSEYFAEHCTVVGSFMAPYEAQRCREIGVSNLMWGSDYPHVEGTWPRTELAMRNTFAAVGREDTRAILGDNGIRAFHLDAAVLRDIADRIGPSPDRLADPLAPEEFPEFRSLAFRELGDYA